MVSLQMTKSLLAHREKRCNAKGGCLFMKKKVLALALATAMVLGLVACGSTAPAPAASEAPAEEAAAEEAPAEEAAEAGASTADVNGDGKVVIGYISKNLTDPFHAPINETAQTTFDALVADGTIDEWTGILDGETDPNKQIDRADDCISKNCDIVIFLPAEAEASDPALTKMADAGIKVIEVNSKSVSCDDVAIAYVGSDDVEAGNMLAQWVVDNCPDGGKFIHCNGVLGNSAQIQRTEGMHAIMDQHPEFEMMEDLDTKWDGNLAANAASDAIAKYGDELVAIICDNDGMSSAAQKMCNDSGREDIICIGVDGVEVPLQMVKEGSLKGTILQDGVGQINGAIDIVKAMVAGEEFDANPVIPFVMVTSDNVDEYLK
jgi:ABC-type sugar transport system substrate-binding protein